MRVIIEPNYKLASQWSANYIAKSINEFGPSEAKPFVLGLPTGSSPLGIYAELIKLNKKGVVSFKDVVVLLHISIRNHVGFGSVRTILLG